MTSFIETIQSFLHIPVQQLEPDFSRIPLNFTAQYKLQMVKILGIDCLLMKPSEQNLPALRKQNHQLEVLLGLPCVLCLSAATHYTISGLISDAIPFVVSEKEVYMPFLGIALTAARLRETTPKEEISFATQRILLSALYEHWTEKTATDVATAMELSNMSITRSFDELQSLRPQLIVRQGRTRKFQFSNGTRALWDCVFPLLRNPVCRQYRLSESFLSQHLRLGGKSALALYAMLEGDPFPTYAVTRQEEQKLGLQSSFQLPLGEVPGCVVHVMRYEYLSPNIQAVDPISAILSLSQAEIATPEIGAAIQSTLESVLFRG
jgi:hypothetical protein